MRYSNEEIRQNLLEWVEETKQTEVIYCVSYCIGFYGYITKQIWNEILSLVKEGVLKA